MGTEAIKLELIQWLSQLEDDETLHYLKIVKDSGSNKNTDWNDLTSDEKTGVERGLQDIRDGKTISHDEVKQKYGL